MVSESLNNSYNSVDEFKVLILVVMEDGLRAEEKERIKGIVEHVLILVLVEDGLRD